MSTNSESSNTDPSNIRAEQPTDEQLIALLRATLGSDECERALETIQDLPSMVELTTPIDDFGEIIEMPEFDGALRSGSEESDVVIEFSEGDLVLQISDSALSGIVPEGWERAALIVQTTDSSIPVDADEDGFFTLDSAFSGPFRMMAHHGERTSSTGWLLH